MVFRLNLRFRFHCASCFLLLVGFFAVNSSPMLSNREDNGLNNLCCYLQLFLLKAAINREENEIMLSQFQAG